MICSLVVACKTGKKEKVTKEGVSVSPEMSSYITTLEKQVQQKPDSVGLRLILVRMLDSAGAYKPALMHMDSLIKDDSMNYALWYKKAQILEHAKDTQAAIINYTNAVKVYPSPDGLLALANLYAETRNTNALLLCKQIDDMHLGREYYGYTAFFAGIYYERTGNAKQALLLFDKSINYNYTFIDAYMEKGFVYYDAKQYAEALKVFQTAVTVNNTYADAYYWQAKTYEALNDKAQAITNYQQALALNKNFSEAEEALKRLK